MSPTKLGLIALLAITGCASLPLRGDHEPQPREYHSRYAEDGFVPGSGSGAITLQGPGSTTGNPLFNPVRVPTNSCVILDGDVDATCLSGTAKRWTWDGSNIKLMSGGSTFQSCSNSTGVCDDAFGWQSSIGSGSDAFKATVAGARWHIGPGTTDYFTSNGGLIITAAGQFYVTSTFNVLSGGAVAVNSAAWEYASPATLGAGFGTSPSITSSHTGTFSVNVGTGGVATSGTINFPTAASNGWDCNCKDITTPGANQTRQTASTTTSCTVTNVAMSTGAGAAWTASDILSCSAGAR